MYDHLITTLYNKHGSERFIMLARLFNNAQLGIIAYCLKMPAMNTTVQTLIQRTFSNYHSRATIWMSLKQCTNLSI
jgi:uncharacterized membrane protein